MYNPPHPGLTLRDDVLPALWLSVPEAEKQSLHQANNITYPGDRMSLSAPPYY